MARRLKYKWTTSRYVLGKDDGYRIRFDIECADEMDDAVFAYRLRPLDPSTGEKAGFFSHVCSPVDLEEYPKNEPRAGELPEWFRLSYIDVVVRSVTEAERFIEDIRADLSRLKTNIDRLDSISPAGEFDVGGDGTCPGSSSSSSAAAEPPSDSSSSASLGDLEMIRAVGTFEQSVGSGADWEAINAGAGSEVGISDSVSGQIAYNRSKTTLQCGQVTKMLLIQGFSTQKLPENAEIVGIFAQLHIRDASGGPSSASSASAGDADDPRLFYFRLYNPDLGPVGDEKSGNAQIFGSDWQVLAMGGASDDWNAGLTAEIFNRGGFGVALIVGVTDDLDHAVVEVDGVELEIYYRG